MVFLCRSTHGVKRFVEYLRRKLGRDHGLAEAPEQHEAQPAGRIFTVILGRDPPVPEADIEARLVREIRYDPDVWIVEVEDRSGRHFLDNAVV